MHPVPNPPVFRFGSLPHSTHKGNSDSGFQVEPLYLVYNATIYTGDPLDPHFTTFETADDAATLAAQALLRQQLLARSDAVAALSPFRLEPVSPLALANATAAGAALTSSMSHGRSHVGHGHGHSLSVTAGAVGANRNGGLLRAPLAWTAAAAAPEAFVVGSDGRFLAVGTLADLTKAHPDIPRLNLHARTVVPGLGDAHGHLASLGMSFLSPLFQDAKSPADVVTILQRFAEKHELNPQKDPGFFLIGSNWDQNDWTTTDADATEDHPFPTAADLDAAFPVLPLVLERVDGHAVWVNSAAMAIVGPIPDADPAGGQIVRDPVTGKPTGVFLDAAMALFYDHPYAEIAPDQRAAALELAVAAVGKQGLTQVHDASMQLDDFHIMRARLVKGREAADPAKNNHSNNKNNKNAKDANTGNTAESKAADSALPTGARVSDSFPLRVHGLFEMEGVCGTADGGYDCPAGYPVRDLDAAQSLAAMLSQSGLHERKLRKEKHGHSHNDVVLNSVHHGDGSKHRPSKGLRAASKGGVKASESTLEDLDLPLVIGSANGRLSAAAVKLFADGALGSWGAAMLEPYTDKPESQGLLIYTAEELATAVAAAVKRGFQVRHHTQN